MMTPKIKKKATVDPLEFPTAWRMDGFPFWCYVMLKRQGIKFDDTFLPGAFRIALVTDQQLTAALVPPWEITRDMRGCIVVVQEQDDDRPAHLRPPKRAGFTELPK